MALGSAGLADARSRAMGILVTYLSTKLNINSDKIGAPVVTSRGKFSSARFKQMCNGTFRLPVDQFNALRSLVLKYLNERQAEIAPDYTWIRPLLIEVGLDHEMNPILVNQVASNQVPLDLEFLR